MTLNKIDFYIAVVLICAAIVGGAYIHAKYSMAVGKHEQIKADAEQVVKETKAQDKQADTKLRETKQAITRTSEQVKTPTDVVASLPLIHSPFAGTVQVQPPLPDSPSSTWKITSEHPIYRGPSSLIVTDPQKFFEAAAECAGSKAELEACQVKLDNSIQREKVQTKRAEDAEKIMEGGGFFRRVKSGLKHSLCGAGGATAGVFTANASSPGIGAGVAFGSFLGCEVLLK